VLPFALFRPRGDQAEAVPLAQSRPLKQLLMVLRRYCSLFEFDRFFLDDFSSKHSIKLEALMTTITNPSKRATFMTGEEKFVIFASSVGTVFECYDFYLYAVLAPFFAALLRCRRFDLPTARLRDVCVDFSGRPSAELRQHRLARTHTAAEASSAAGFSRQPGFWLVLSARSFLAAPAISQAENTPS
jgi:hypothetical protein